jgi:hypothetical protein
MEPERPVEYPIRKRTLPEQCQYWESELVKVAERMRRKSERHERAVVLAAAFFLGDLADRILEGIPTVEGSTLVEEIADAPDPGIPDG